MADLSKLPKIYFKRTGATFTKDGVEGLRGTLTAGTTVFETIERGGGYVKLPKGEFFLTLDMHDRLGRKVFFVYHDKAHGGHGVINEEGRVAEIMVHSADTPDDLKGCLAPGRSFDAESNTLLQSTDAMNDLFAFFNHEKAAGWIVVE